MSRPLDWNEIDLVVFDVDGTLYNQRRLRVAMLRPLIAHAWQSCSIDALRTLRTFRRVREALGNEAATDFLQQQYARTASRHNKTSDEVRLLTTEWMEQRPLPMLAACRYPQVDALFAALRAHGKQIAVFSDYPALEKLAALGLNADPVVCATDPDIARLKPDPTGLLEILRRTGIPAQRTLMIGDRADRDGVAARRAGVSALILGGATHPEFGIFRRYDDPVFAPLLMRTGASAPA